MKWPKEMPVVNPGDVRAGAVYNADGTPNCACGWFDFAFGAKPDCDFDAISPLWDINSKASKAYQRVAATVSIRPIKSGMFPSYINDSVLCSDEQRALVFNATNAALGYIVGQDPAAVRLAREAGFKV